MTRTIAAPSLLLSQPHTARHNMRCAGQIARALTGGQPTQVVISPGSRCTPLTLAFDALPEVTLHVVLDERAAAFVALGVARSSGQPAIALCTSGSAGTHYGPACVEAAYSRVPLILLTADRPAELHHCGAPQTIAQDHLLPEPLRMRVTLPVAGEAVSDAWLAALGAQARRAACGDGTGPAGPIHLNVPFREPLWHPDHPPTTDPAPAAAPPMMAAPNIDGADGPSLVARGGPNRSNRPNRDITSMAAGLSTEAVRALLRQPLAPARGVIVCGPQIGPYDAALGAAARRLARALGWPIIAEAASGVRFDAAGDDFATAGDDFATAGDDFATAGDDFATAGGIIRCADALLRSPSFAARVNPDAVLLLGQTPTSKPLRTWLCSMPGRGLSIDPNGQWSDPTGCAAHVVAAPTRATLEQLTENAASTARTPDADWTALWQQAQNRVAAVLSQHAKQGVWEGRVAYELSRHLPAGSQLLVGSSMPIRDLDSFAATDHAGLRVSANRGCNGIDGGVATASGMALGDGRPTFAWLGDLALLHDLDGLEAAGCASWPLTLVVVNNRGGGIFEQLPIANNKDVFERLFATPRKAQLAPLCAALGAHYQEVDLGEGDFPAAITRAAQRGGLQLLEITVDRKESVRRRRDAWRAAAEVLETQP